MSEITDSRLEQLSNQVLDYCDTVFELDRNVDSLHIAQLDEPWCDSSKEIRFFLRTKGGNSKAKIINAIVKSDLPLRLESTCPNHAQLTFTVCE